MNAVNRKSGALRPGLRFGRCWIPTSLLGWVATVGGCAAVAGFAAAVLTGLFIGRLATSLQATAHSYRYSDAGDVGLQFAAPTPTSISLVRFFGRLPGFHIVFIHAKQGITSQVQEEEAIVYDTDVEIDFTTSPPTFTGTARERDGDGTLPLDELFPNAPDVSAEIGAPDEEGVRRLTLAVGGENASGDQIEYALIVHLGPGGDTGLLSASVEIERTFTPAGGEPETLTGAGSLTASRDDG